MTQVKSRSKSGRRGQALIEVLVAVSVLTIGFLGIVTILNRALSLNRVVSDNYTATYLAAEGIEITKNILDATTVQKKPWGDGFFDGDFEVDRDSLVLEPFGDRPIRFDPITKAYSYSGSEATPYHRRITISVRSGEIVVTSRVDWVTRGGGAFSVDLEDHFYNWR